MQTKRIEIAPGVGLTSIETAKFKTNIATVNFILPLGAETVSQNALVPPVLMRGTKAYPTMSAINERQQFLYDASVGTRNYKRGEAQIIGFTTGMIDNGFIPDGTDVFGGALDLLAGIVFEPVIEGGAFKAEYVESEKKTLIDGINARINDKQRYATNRMFEIMCENEKFSVTETGTVESVAAVTPAEVCAAWKNMLATAPVEIFYVGRDAEKNSAVVRDKFAAAFARVKRDVAPMPVTEVIRAAGEVKEVVEEQPVAQGKLAIGLRSGRIISDSDFAAYNVMQVVYGSGTTSKLFMNVRERLSLCYYCSAGTESVKGVMTVQSGIEVPNYEVAKNEIFAQLENIKNGIVTVDEIDSAKKTLRNAYLGMPDNAWSIENWYFSHLFTSIETTPEAELAAMEAVTAEQITEAARGVSVDTIYFLKGTLLGNNDGGEN